MTDEVTAGIAADKSGAGSEPLPNGEGNPNVPAARNPETDLHEDARSPMEKAVANGFKEEPTPSREERAATVVAELEHAVQHNAPVTLSMLKEIRDLLDVPAPDQTPVAEVSEAKA